MERKYEVGQHVVYVDRVGTRQDALVTVWWGPGPGGVPGYTSETGEPGCNVVIVSKDAAKTDSYGRQIERETSIVHRSKQPAPAFYWCWPDE